MYLHPLPVCNVTTRGTISILSDKNDLWLIYTSAMNSGDGHMLGLYHLTPQGCAVPAYDYRMLNIKS